MDLTHLDEYTALQKYISTYRDPKAAAAEKAEESEAKPKKSWQVSAPISIGAPACCNVHQ